MALREREWPLVDVLLKRFAFEEEAGIKPGQEGSSLTNLHFFSYLFGLDIRNLQDGHLHALIRDQGALHLAHDVASTFLSGAHVGSAAAESMVKARETITTSLRVANQEGGKDAAEGKEVAEEEKEADVGGKKGAGASMGKAENGKHNDAEPVLEWKLQQRQGRRGTGGVLDWMDLFYDGVFRRSLANANSLGLSRAQGRLVPENPRNSNKPNFQMGAGEVAAPVRLGAPVSLRCDDHVAHKVTKLGDARGASSRRLVVIFSLLGLLHTLHEATEEIEVCSVFKLVVGHLLGDKEASHFVQLLLSEGNREKMAGRFFLSEMERRYVRQSLLDKNTFGDGGDSTTPTVASALNKPGTITVM
eukprot:jgi/Undpi1/13363/HiC_scaffold_8.g03022.m1